MFGKSRTASQTGIILALLSLLMGMLACTMAAPTPVILVKTFTPTLPLPSSTTTPTEPAASPTPTSLAKATIIVKTCFLRSGPGKTFRSNGAAKAGDIFPVFGKDPTGDWYQINWENPTWIAAELVKLDVDPALVPTVTLETGLAGSPPMETLQILEPSSTTTLLPTGTSTAKPSETAQPSSTATFTPQPINTISPTPGVTIQPSATLTTPPIQNYTPTPVVTNGKIEVSNISIYQSSDVGLGMVVYGEVSNRDVTPIKNARVTISIYGADNNLLETESRYIYTPWGQNLWSNGLLYSNQKAPFELIFNNSGLLENYKAEIEYETAGPGDTAIHYNNLAVKNDSGTAIQDFLYNYQITGEVENTGNSSCGNVWLVATLYDKNGLIVGVEEGATDLSQLSPGQSAPFNIKIATHGDVASYRLLVDAISQ